MHGKRQLDVICLALTLHAALLWPARPGASARDATRDSLCASCSSCCQRTVVVAEEVRHVVLPLDVVGTAVARVAVAAAVAVCAAA